MDGKVRLRAVLTVSAEGKGAILRASASRPDLLVADLAVLAREKKAHGRELVESLAREGLPGAVSLAAGLDDLDSLDATLDLKAVVRPGVSYILVPRVDLPEEVHQLDGAVEDLEGHFGLEVGRIRLLLALGEGAASRLGEIAGASRRLAALLPACKPIASPAARRLRARLPEEAAAVGVASIDAPHPNPLDPRGLLEEAREALDLGYSGKLAIHPRQVATIQELFSGWT